MDMEHGKQKNNNHISIGKYTKRRNLAQIQHIITLQVVPKERCCCRSWCNPKQKYQHLTQDPLQGAVFGAEKLTRIVLDVAASLAIFPPTVL